MSKQERSESGRRLLSEIAHSIEAGQTLSSSLEAHADLFSVIDLNLIRAGEEGGFLPDAIERIAFIREWQHKLISGAWGAAAYPLVLISLATLLVPAMLMYLVPKLEPSLHRFDETLSYRWRRTCCCRLAAQLNGNGLPALAGAALVGLAIFAVVSKGTHSIDW